jgi:CheY-like chemotaxis protein
MDDDCEIVDVAEAMLASLGYEMDHADEGGAAVSLFRQALASGAPYDAVILDLTVPGGMGGRDAVVKILALDPKARVIVSSGYSNDAVMADYRSYGFVAVMTKPYRIEEMSRVVYNAIHGEDETPSLPSPSAGDEEG